MAFTYCHISKECSKCLKLSSIPPKGPTGEIQGRENLMEQLIILLDGILIDCC